MKKPKSDSLIYGWNADLLQAGFKQIWFDIPNDLARDDAFSFPRPFADDETFLGIGPMGIPYLEFDGQRISALDKRYADPTYWTIPDLKAWRRQIVALKFKYADLP